MCHNYGSAMKQRSSLFWLVRYTPLDPTRLDFWDCPKPCVTHPVNGKISGAL